MVARQRPTGNSVRGGAVGVILHSNHYALLATHSTHYALLSSYRLMHTATTPSMIGGRVSTPTRKDKRYSGRRHHMALATAKSTANAVWEGSLMEGSGQVGASSGAFSDLGVSWAARTDRGITTTSPEELLASSHAACYCMALSNGLTQAGTPPTKLEVSATVTFASKRSVGRSPAAPSPSPAPFPERRQRASRKRRRAPKTAALFPRPSQATSN